MRIPDRTESDLHTVEPDRAAAFSLKINGQSQAVPVQQGYAVLMRTWRAGDSMELTLPVAPRLVEADPLAEQMAHKAAVLRGPVVYLLESPDLPAGVAVHEALLPGTVALKAVALERPAVAPRGEGPLHAPVSVAPARRQCGTRGQRCNRSGPFRRPRDRRKL